MRLENCVRIGYFQRTHGIEGTLVLDFSPEWGLSLASTTILILEINGLPVPWFIAEYGIRITSANTALVDLEWIEDDASAQKLCGLKVFLEKKRSYRPEKIRITAPMKVSRLLMNKMSLWA